MVSHRAGVSPSKRVRDVGRDGHGATGGDRDLHGLVPDLEYPRALQHVERVDVVVGEVRFGYMEAGGILGASDGDLDLAFRPLKDLLGRRHGKPARSAVRAS
jgi:hypothetical protein